MGWWKKPYLTALLKSSVVACGFVFAFTTFSQADHLSDSTGGIVYCGQGIPLSVSVAYEGIIEFPTKMGLPETWSNEIRMDIYKTITHDDNKRDVNIDTDDVPSELFDETKREGKFIFPCAILKDKASWKRYWLNDPAAKQRIKVLKQTHEKYMDCLYDHRKEINKLNKNVIEHTCKKRTRWKPPGIGSVAESEM